MFRDISVNVLLRVFRSKVPGRGRRAGPRRLRLEILEFREVLAWSGVPPVSIVPPSNAVVLGLDSQGDTSRTATIASTEVDYFTFTAGTAGSYRINVNTPTSNLDPVLGVFSTQGNRLAYNDDISATNRDSQLTLALTAGQRIYVGVTNYIGTAGGSYQLLIDGPAAGTPDDSYENNDSLAQAANLGTVTTARTIPGLRMADSADWFRFSTTAAGTSGSYVEIFFTHSQGDLDLRLYDGNGTLRATSDGVTNSERVSLNGLGAGTYYVRVYGYQGVPNPNYSLTVQPPTASSPGGFEITMTFSGLSASQRVIFQQAANRWSQIITGDLPNATYNGQVIDDLRIDASSVAIDGPGNILGQANATHLRGGSSLPYRGFMQFDSADLAQMEANGQLYSVILHEMGHVLGVGTIWANRGLLTGAGTSNPRFRGAQATAAYNEIFGVNELSVPVEGNNSPVGSRDSHWRESVFGNELMSPYISGSSNPISRVTVGSLADVGYTVNFAAADNFAPGLSRLTVGPGMGSPGNSTAATRGVFAATVGSIFGDESGRLVAGGWC